MLNILKWPFISWPNFTWPFLQISFQHSNMNSFFVSIESEPLAYNSDIYESFGVSLDDENFDDDEIKSVDNVFYSRDKYNEYLQAIDVKSIIN